MRWGGNGPAREPIPRNVVVAGLSMVALGLFLATYDVLAGLVLIGVSLLRVTR